MNYNIRLRNKYKYYYTACDEMEEFADELKENNTLTELIIIEYITSDQCKYLFEALKVNNTLTTLTIIYNYNIKPEECKFWLKH